MLWTAAQNKLKNNIKGVINLNPVQFKLSVKMKLVDAVQNIQNYEQHLEPVRKDSLTSLTHETIVRCS